jgi:plastocyanin
MKGVVIAAMLASVLVAGCGGNGGGDAAAAPRGAAVEIRTFMYSPDPLKVKTGERVTWTNLDGTVHTVTAGTRETPDAESFDGRLEKDGKFSHTFDKAGTYDYYCTRHSGPGMTAKVVVE